MPVPPPADPPRFRDVYAPGTPRDSRRPPADLPAASGSMLAFWAMCAVLFSLAGTAVLGAGRLPAGVDPVAFRLVAGGGCLLVGVTGLVGTVRIGLRRAAAGRRGRWAGALIGGAELARLADSWPDLGEAVRQEQLATGRIRASRAYRERWLRGALDDGDLERADWSTARLAQRIGAGRAGLREIGDGPPLAGIVAARTADLDSATTALSDQLAAVEQLAAAVERVAAGLAGLDPGSGPPDPATHPVAGVAVEDPATDLRRAADAVAEVERLIQAATGRKAAGAGANDGG